MDYEESLTPYLICSTLKKAEKIKKEILDFYDAILKTIPDEPQQSFWDESKKEWIEDSEEVFETKYLEWLDKRDETLLNIKNPPFEIMLNYSDLTYQDKQYGIDQNLINIMELHLV